MNRSWSFVAIGTLVLFVSMFAPFSILLAWLTENALTPFLAVAAIVSVVGFFTLWHTLNKSSNMILRWVWMQALGLGTVLMSLTLVGLMLTLWLPPATVGRLVLVAWIALSLFAIWQAVTIKIRNLKFDAPELSENLTLVQISDVHIGSRSAAFLDRVVDKVMAQAPDIVVITGDLLDSSSVTQVELAALSRLPCPVYMCIGNHERYVDLDKALSAIETQGVTVLRDCAVKTRGLQIIGIDDRDRPNVLPDVLNSIALDSACYSILLYHRPDGWQAGLDANIQLMLAGHTHAGQMFPFGLLVKRQYPNMAGLFTEAGKSLYVSVGTGTWGPIFRLGTQSELTVIELDVGNKSQYTSG